jgi:hypothetical protein
MTRTIDDEKKTIQKVIRGERPLSDLRALGIEIEFRSDGRVLRTKHPVSASADLHDVALGFRTYRNDPENLKLWAFFVEAADVDIDVGSHPAGETLLGAIWDASFGEPLDAAAVQAIQQLTGINEKS